MYSGIMYVLDDAMGQNGLEHGITAGCRRFSFNFECNNRREAEALCEDVGLIYDGEVVATYDNDDEDPADWWKR